MLAHRINGYAVITLVAVAIPGALMVMRHSMGGGLDLQSAVVGLSFAVLFALSMAYINIKKLQIDQHRKWMLRAMIWMSLIITARIVMYVAAEVISSVGGYYTVSTESSSFPDVIWTKGMRRSGFVKRLSSHWVIVKCSITRGLR
jgi:hypothetical protein